MTARVDASTFDALELADPDHFARPGYPHELYVCAPKRRWCGATRAGTVLGGHEALALGVPRRTSVSATGGPTR
jgi:hypothetical protein